MPVPRIYCDIRLGPGAQFALPDDAANHVARALRLQHGDALMVFDGRGGEYHATILRIDHGHVDVKVGGFDAIERESPVVVNLVQGIPESDRMDWIIQKAVELGVVSIRPVVCDRSVVRLAGERAARREAHWQRVAVAAVEQCGRNRVPQVAAPVPFQSWSAPGPAGATRWLLAPGAPALASQPMPAGPVELLVGPEGGFSERENDLALSAGFRALSLGPRVLRTETAPLAALAAMNALWGDFAR